MWTFHCDYCQLTRDFCPRKKKKKEVKAKTERLWNAIQWCVSVGWNLSFDTFADSHLWNSSRKKWYSSSTTESRHILYTTFLKWFRRYRRPSGRHTHNTKRESVLLARKKNRMLHCIRSDLFTRWSRSSKPSHRKTSSTGS